MRLRWLVALLWFVLLIPVQGQSAFTEYDWQAADYALLIPAGWDDPLPTTSEDGFRQTLLLAQNFASNPTARPPGTPVIELAALPLLPEETDLNAELLRLLDALDIDSRGTLPGNLLGQDAIFAAGSSADGALFGVGRAVTLADGGALFIVGRAAQAQQASFLATFETVANSIVQGNIAAVVPPEYGLLWRTERTPADGEFAFLEIGGLARTSAGQLVLADAVAGLVRIDPASGVVLGAQPFASDAEPAGMAVAADGALYVADALCGCVRVITNGAQTQRFAGFSVDAPRSIALASDGTLYATNFSDSGEVVLRAFSAEGERTISFAEPLADQPLLAADQSGRVFALSRDLTLYGLQEEAFAPFFTLESGTTATAFSFDPNNNLLVGTADEGLLIFDNTGVLLNSVELGTFGDLLGVAAAPDGTLYVADGDGGFGAVSALRLGIAEGRTGAPVLLPGRQVAGAFTAQETRHIWYYEATSSETLTLTAVAAADSFGLDVGLRVVAPGGAELAFSTEDDTGLLLNPLDAQVRALRPTQPDWVAVVVEREAGEGIYQLGLSVPREIDITEGTTVLGGRLGEALPAQRYTFPASGGQSLTITLTAQSGTLDPLLRLLDANGNVLAENDDADDPALGRNAQIVDFEVPFNSTYSIEAGRFAGEGEYTLSITPGSD